MFRLGNARIARVVFPLPPWPTKYGFRNVINFGSVERGGASLQKSGKNQRCHYDAIMASSKCHHDVLSMENAMIMS